jgi:hypothetical protein
VIISKRWSALEVFCFGMAGIMIAGWSYALVVAWDLNAHQLPQTLLIIAALIGVGFYRRKKRLDRLNRRVQH